MRIEVLKAVLVLSLFFITFIASLLPFALRQAATVRMQDDRRQRHISGGPSKSRRTYVLLYEFLSVFGGGVFLATALLDLLPDTREALAKAFKALQIGDENREELFPLPEFMIAIGFFLILIMEQIAVWWKEREISPEVQPLLSKRRNTIEAVVAENEVQQNAEQYAHHPSSHHPESHHQPRPMQKNRRRRRSSSVQGSHIDSYDTFEETGRVEVDGVQRHRDPSESSADDEDQDMTASIHFDPDAHSSLRAILLVAALSLHSTFEGMALGLEDTAKRAMQIFAALIIHKTIIGFSLGLRLVQSSLKNFTIVCCCFVFTLMCAIGAVIGISVSSVLSAKGAQNGVGDLITGLLQGVACGTFLYVTFFEVLPHELNPPGYRLQKLIVLLLGFGLVCSFIYFGP